MGLSYPLSFVGAVCGRADAVSGRGESEFTENPRKESHAPEPFVQHAWEVWAHSTTCSQSVLGQVGGPEGRRSQCSGFALCQYGPGAWPNGLVIWGTTVVLQLDHLGPPDPRQPWTVRLRRVSVLSWVRSCPPAAPKGVHPPCWNCWFEWLCNGVALREMLAGVWPPLEGRWCFSSSGFVGRVVAFF